jgi:hypothetical protein
MRHPACLAVLFQLLVSTLSFNNTIISFPLVIIAFYTHALFAYLILYHHHYLLVAIYPNS